MRQRPPAAYVDRDSDWIWLGTKEARTLDMTVEGPTQFRVGFLQFPDPEKTFPEARCRVRVKRWKQA